MNSTPHNKEGAGGRLSRRGFLKAGLMAAGAIGAGGGIHAAVIEPFNIEMSQVDVRIKNLPKAFDGFRIAQLSDIHHGAFVGLSHVRRIVNRVNRIEPDLVVLTGDYVTRNPDAVEPVMEALSRLSARHGTVGILGNHDHRVGAEHVRARMAAAGIPDLTNRNIVVRREEAALAVGGVGDMYYDFQNLGLALEGVPADAPRIVLSHNPDYAENLPPEPRVDIILAGHTHGGQMFLPHIGSPLVPSHYGQKYRAGMVQGRSCPVYISRGIGVVAPPIRINCRPEIPTFTLRPA